MLHCSPCRKHEVVVVTFCFGFSSHYTSEDGELSAEVVIGKLTGLVDRSNVNRFNVSRGRLWDSARRGILRTQFDPRHSLYVKFTDDIGTAEEAIDNGGPKREYLQLLMDYMSTTSPLFTGPPACRHLTYLSSGVYFVVRPTLPLSINVLYCRG